MKKRLIKLIALLFAIIMLGASLAACNRLSGIYTSVDSEVGTSYEFHFFGGKVTMYYLNYPYDGEYELDKSRENLYDLPPRQS